jgi:isopentenyl-diphosphate Delta-isomerase
MDSTLPSLELVDVLSPDGRKTGRAVLRSLAHAEGLWHRTVHVWVRNAGGELLLQKRSIVKETFPGLWDISAAGHICAGQLSEDAAIREMGEELGIVAKIGSLRFLFTIQKSYVSPDRRIKDFEISDVYLCTIPIEKNAITPDPLEVSDVEFHSVSDLKKLLVEKKELFVPHDEEYGRLFEIIDGAQSCL